MIKSPNEIKATHHEFEKMKQNQEMEHINKVIRDIEPMIPTLKKMVKEFNDIKYNRI